MRHYFILLCLAAYLISCNEEISVGSSLLDDNSIQVEYTDSASLSGYSVYSDPVSVYRNSTNFSTRIYMLGELNDPILGRSSSQLYLSSNIPNLLFPNFDTLKIDSVIMVLHLDTLGSFAKDGAFHDIEVRQLKEELLVAMGDTVFSNQSFEVEDNIIGSYSGVVNHRDSIQLFSPVDDSLVRVTPQLRIPLDTMLWHEIARDTLINKVPASYGAFIKGFQITSRSPENSIIGLDLSLNNVTAIELFYSANDTTHNVYSFQLGGIRTANFIHDYSGTPSEAAVNDSLKSEWYIQEMEGLNLQLDLSSVLEYSDKVINRATIELVLVDEVDPIVEPVTSLRATYISQEGTKLLLLDNAIVQNTALDVFGGTLEPLIIDGQDVMVYQLDITNHVNAIVSGIVKTPYITLESSSKAQGARRSIIYGSESNVFPAKLKLITSNP